MAFVRLWRDANPMLTRYLRVAGASDVRATALGAWGRVVRELGAFTGDEIAWRGWLLACAREHVEELLRRRGRGSGSQRPGRGATLAGIEELSVGAPPEPTTLVEPAELRGVNDTIAAIRDLPLGQGEILVLRLLCELPVAKVADLVGTDVVAVRRSEDRAVERLGAERELIAWSLAAPALPDELVDQRRALAVFRDQRTGRTPVTGPSRVVALTPGPDADKPPAIVRSRVALLCIAALSASAMSAGALSAAAYVDILPGGLQHVMHQVIGAPEASDSTHPGPSSSLRPGATPSAAAMLALCRAWAAQSSMGPARQHSAVFRSLVSAAGGAANVGAYCASVATSTVGIPKLPPVSARTSGASPSSPRGTTAHATTSAKTQPMKTQPTKTPPTKRRPSKTEPTKARPAKSQPGRTPSATTAPATPAATSHSAATARSQSPTVSASAASTTAQSQAGTAHPATLSGSQQVTPATRAADGGPR